MDRPQLVALVRRLANRDAPRSEAEVQADVRALLLWGGLDLTEAGIHDVNLETPAGMRRRIDVEAGCAIIEVKRDLRVGNVATAAADQLAGYVRQRLGETGLRYVGILTDGAEWRLYHLGDDQLALASVHTVSATAPDLDALLIWLEGILATRVTVPPTPQEIERRLGAASSAFALDRAELLSMYRRCRDVAEVALKRELYAKLLKTAFGTQFTNDDELFVEHSLLVAMAKLIAHLILGVSIATQERTPRELLDGIAFQQADIRGVVEGDFFDWVLDAPGGEPWLRSLARRLSRFAWKQADHDVLKVLYESIIDARTRHRIGEYYTPDWLAERIVAEVVREPLEMRCADVSCGSGTFLFHAVRHHLRAADAAGLSNREAIHSVVSHVLGMDVHPVAVILARVTYLLALGADRIAGERDGFAVPVYLGDTVQWRHEQSLLSEGKVAVKTSEGSGLFSEELVFPETVLADADLFDRLVAELTARATIDREKGIVPSIDTILDRYGVEGADRETVVATFRHLCALDDEGRDQIWGYYVRNLVRPVWLAQEPNRVDALIGNPPWLAYRYMTPAMQAEFRRLSRERGLWAGAKVATHQDLSALFVVRAIEQYLADGGRFGFVMPQAVLSRLAYRGFRKGQWGSPRVGTAVRFDVPWSFGHIKPPIFEVPSCVVTGTHVKGTREEPAVSMPADGVVWTGRRPAPSSSWEEALRTISQTAGRVHVVDDVSISPYDARFTQGATFVPRLLFIVEDAPTPGILSAPAGRRRVTSRRDPSEKPPWRNLPSLTQAVERQFVRPIHLGRTVLPFRALEPALAIVPWDGKKLLSSADPDLARYPGLEAWWKEAERIWTEHRSSQRLSLLAQLDYQRKLSKQLPTPMHRVVYSASGQYLAAARVDDPEAVIDTKLYWAPCESIEEARYLTAVLNSPSVTQALQPYQSRGEHNPRDFHKLVFRLPIPKFAPGDKLHRAISDLAGRAEEVVAAVEVSASRRFEALRRDCRRALENDGVLGEIDAAVTDLLGLA